MHVFRAGENKSAVEPYLRDDMSDAEREVVSRWLNGLWSTYTEMAESGRELSAGTMNTFIASFPDQLEASSNDLAQTMLDAGWVDALADHAQMDEALAEWVGVTDEDGFAEMVHFERYIDDIKSQRAIEQEGSTADCYCPSGGDLGARRQRRGDGGQ